MFFSCFHNYVSKNALLDMCYFLIFGHNLCVLIIYDLTENPSETFYIQHKFRDHLISCFGKEIN